jgi:glutaredoxin 3
METKADKKIIIYSKPECPFCDKAKLFFEELSLPYEYIMLDPSSADYEARRDELKASTCHRSFPFVYIGDEFVGGFTELIQAHRTNRLHELCERIGLSLAYDF